MMILVDPISHEKYQTEIDTLISLLRASFGKNFQFAEEERASSTYILAKKAPYGVYGGALLRKVPFCSFEPHIEALLSILHSHKRKAWVAHFCTGLQENTPVSYQDKTLLFREFYLTLYRKFLLFGRKHLANFLVVSVGQSDSILADLFNSWPYIVKVSLKSHEASFSQGILDMRPERRRSLSSDRPSSSDMGPLRNLADRKVKRHPKPRVVRKDKDPFGVSSQYEPLPLLLKEGLLEDSQRQGFDSDNQHPADRPAR